MDNNRCSLDCNKDLKFDFYILSFMSSKSVTIIGYFDWSHVSCEERIQVV